MNKIMIFMIIILVLLLSCNFPSDKSSMSDVIKPSEFPLKPDDPRAKLTIDQSKYKDFDFSKIIKSKKNGTKIEKENNFISYEPKSKKSITINSNQIKKSNSYFTEPNHGVVNSKISSINKLIVESDDRIKVTDTTQYSYCTVVKLYINSPNGGGTGTGVMIGPKAVLTTGHCVNDGAGTWASSIQVIPALNGTYMPYGDAWGTAYMTTTAWAINSDYTQDYAVIILDRNIGYYSGWSGMSATFSQSELLDKWARSYGYPGDKDGGLCMYTDFDKVISINSAEIGHKIDTMGGQSGSPIYLRSDTNYVRAIHSSSDGVYNYAPYITPDRFNIINQAMIDHENDPVIW